MASSSVGSSVWASSLVGSSVSHGMGGTSDSCTWVSSSSSVMGTTGVSTGMGAWVHPSGSSCMRYAAPSWMASSVKAT